MDVSSLPAGQHGLVDSAETASPAAATINKLTASTATHPVIAPVQPVTVTKPPQRLIPIVPPPTTTELLAPAWLYSALAMLGKSFTASDGSTQSFGVVLCGSDVDPYAELGATRLFCVSRLGDALTLGVSPDASSPAPFGGSGSFPITDEGILALFTALAKTPAFAAANYAYVPGGRAELYPGALVLASPAGGYDPATGLREMVLGSAVTQVVPLATFEATSNTQVYNPSPVIVPIMTSLVYDITENNTAGSTTYTLPAAYVLDQVTAGTIYVNKMAGPTIVNAGGPGYSESDPTAVVSGFTFAGGSPLAAFANQRIAGFYVGPGWQDTLGTPIWDFGSSNGQFTAVTGTLTAPVTVFDPANSPLNGGTIPAVIGNLEHAQYLLSRDRLASMLASARESGDATPGAITPPAVAATAASLSFDFPPPSSDVSQITNTPAAAPPAAAAAAAAEAPEASGEPLQVTDSSLFIFSNLDVDNGEVGQLSPSDVFVAGATVNCAPTTRTSTAFAPNPFLLGLVRSVQMGGTRQFVFTPADDSIEINGTRYVVSVIQVNDLSLDPNSLPYPPSAWPQSRYWQFANRHDPYLAVRYSGSTEAARIAQSQEDIATIGLATSGAQEPMQMYLDTGAQGMALWPIYGFPLSIETQTFNVATLNSLNETIIGLINDPVVYSGAAATITNLGEITVPGVLTQSNPYATPGALGSTASANGAASATSGASDAPGTITIPGIEVTNLNPTVATAQTFAASAAAQQSADALAAQQAAASASASKSLSMTALPSQQNETLASLTPVDATLRKPQGVFGFSAYSDLTGEAYLIEVVGADLTVPDRLPDPTENADYDPYYVRVVFLSNLTCYSMSVIVPSIAYDKHGYFARQGIEYDNVVSKTDELGLGYMYSLYDSSNNFDELRFIPYGQSAELTAREEASASSGGTPVVFTNAPYSTDQTATFNPGSVFAGLETERDLRKQGSALNLTNLSFLKPPVPPPYFVCRRRNWSADCHLMQAMVPEGTSIYLAFGGGDIIPMRLDTPATIDKRLPTHMNQLSYAFTGAAYAAVEAFSVANIPYVVAVSTQGGVAAYSSLSIDPTAGTASVTTSTPAPLAFSSEIYVVGQASTTLTSMTTLNTALGTSLTSTADLWGTDANGNTEAVFAVVPYNNLVYLVRAMTNVPALGAIDGTGITSGLLIDTFVPTTSGDLAHAQSARYKRSGLAFFGQSYTPTTMIDSLDNLDFTDIAGNIFYAPTIFIPIAELDATPGVVVDIANFTGEEFWTFLYAEQSAAPGAAVGGLGYPNGLNIDQDGKPILSVQKLQFVYDPTAVLFTPNDLTHKYPLSPKQQVLALANGQVQEGICWRSANLQPDRVRPRNVQAQQILDQGWDMDATNIIYSPSNRPVQTATQTSYLGMSVHSIKSLSATTYNIEESAFGADPTATGFVSAVSSVQNMLLGVVFDYDNNDLGTLATYDPSASNKALVFVNGYLSGGGYAFSSPDHMDVNDVLPSELPLLEQVASTLGLGWDVAMYDVDVTLPREFWTFSFDTATAPSLPNFIPNVPPAPADPGFANRTRSVLLNLQNPIQPTQIGLMDTYSSVVSANLVLDNGITGGVFLSKKADRNVASIGSNPGPSATTFPLSGLPAKYDFFLFSRDHYDTLGGAQFLLIDEGYAMVLVDDGTGTGTKVAKYSVDTDGNYYELFSYVLLSPDTGVLETSTFPLKVTLGSPANPDTAPPTPETPNSVNPQDLVTQINSVSGLIYAALGASAPGQPPAYLPIQATSLGDVQAGTITGQPGFSGYALNVVGQNHQPIQITQLYSGSVAAYQIAGTTTIVPYNYAKEKAVPYYGSISHGLDKQVTLDPVTSADGTVTIPRPNGPPSVTQGIFGGAGVGGLIGTTLSLVFQGSAAIPPATDATPGTTLKGDDSVFYTANVAASTTMDSTGKSGSLGGGQYFVDSTDPANPIYGVVTLPKFIFNLSTYTVNLATTDPATGDPRYTLVVGGQSYPFGPGNTQVTADRSTFTFNPVTGGAYTVTYAAIDAPAEAEAPTPIALTPFTVTMGGAALPVDVFNDPGALSNMVLGPIGRTYTFDAAAGTVTVTAGATSTTSPLQTGLIFASASDYGYVITVSQGDYQVNGTEAVSYTATTSGEPASYPIMTAPQVFTLDGTFYTFDQNASGTYESVTGGGQTILVNNDQFSINGEIYVIDTNVSPNTVIGAGNTYPMTDQNTQVEIDGVPFTITLKSGALTGGTVSGQFDITQGNVVVIENFVYLLDTLNSQVVGNGLAYPLTTSGVTYDVTTAGNTFTVTARQNEETATIGNIDYVIGNTSVVADGVTYPILVYRSFADSPAAYDIGLDGTVSTATTFTLSNGQFTDGPTTYTTNLVAAFDGLAYYPMTGSPRAFTTSSRTYTIRTDGVAFLAGPAKTYFAPSGALSPNAFPFGTESISFGRPRDLAAFDGTNYYEIQNNEFTDSTGATWTLSGDTAISGGNSYEIYSNLGATPYFEVPDGATFQVSLPVADTGSASGDVYSVFPISSGTFTMPVKYELTATGNSASVQSVTYGADPVAVATLTANSGSLTGGFFTDPVTGITYTVVVNDEVITVVDSSNTVVPFPQPGLTDTFVAQVVVSTAVTIAVDNEPTPRLFPVLNNQFTAGNVAYSVSVPVATANAGSGPYYPITNGRFVVPETPPASAITYVISGNSVRRGYVLGTDDQFSSDGTVTYTVNEVNVVKTDSRPTLSTVDGTPTITAGPITYQLGATPGLATTSSEGLTFNQAAGTFTAGYPGGAVTYTLSGETVTDSRTPQGSWQTTTSGSVVSFTDATSGVTFSFDPSGDNPVTAGFAYSNDFFIDVLSGTTFFVDTSTSVVNAISYLPETTAYGFVAANGVTYLIHFRDVEVVFPVVSGANVNVGVATVGNDQFDVQVDEVIPIGGGSAIPANANSFEINGDRYSIVGTPNGTDYSSCSVVGAGLPPVPFATASTFSLTDPSVVYTLQLDAGDLPVAVTAVFPVQPSRDVISVADDVYVITYATTATGSLLGQRQSKIPVANSAFTLTNPYDSTKGSFTFADPDIYDASAVIGKFSIYASPSFQMGSVTYTLDPVNSVVRDESKRPYPLIANPQMFSVTGANYVIDTNQVPHAIVGNETTSPLQTDVTIVDGKEVGNSTFPLGGQIYRYVEDAAGNLLCVTGTKLYPMSQPAGTFKLDSSLVFTLTVTPPAAGDYPGTTVPIGVITAGPTAAPTTTANLYAGTNESGGSAFFTYKGQLYTLVESESTYVAIQKTATVYVSDPTATQQQLAVFDLAGWTNLVTDGTTPGTATAAGINPGTLWSQTATSTAETVFGLVYGLGATPTNVTAETLPSGATQYQFAVTAPTGIGTATATTLYDVIYQPGSATNVVQVDVPSLFPSFTQTADFTFTPAYPLSLETGGYNAFTFSVAETGLPEQSFAASYKTPVTSTDPALDNLMTPQGDFSVEFWHSIPSTTPAAYHPFTYQSSGAAAPNGATAPVSFIDVDFEDASDIYLQVNSTVMTASVVLPVFTAKWQHFALSYTQPYVMVCQGAGFEVQNGTNYNVEREFSIAFTFSVSDANTMQGIVYKGSGSLISAPEYVASYSVYVEGGQLFLVFQDGTGKTHTHRSPAGSIEQDTLYQVIIVKTTQSPLGSDDGSDPYAPPFSPADLSSLSTQGFTTNATLPSDGNQNTLTVKGIQPAGASTPTANLLTSIGQFANQIIEVDISIAEVFADGSIGTPLYRSSLESVSADVNLQVLPTGSAHVLLGTTYDDNGTEYPLGSPGAAGNIRDVYIFGSAIASTGIPTSTGTIPISQATTEQLVGASICGYWQAAYDPNGTVQNPVNQNDVAVTTNALLANLLPLAGHELEGTALFINGAPMSLGLVTGSAVPPSMTGRTTGSWLTVNAGQYKIQEISMWQMARQQYQVIDDMFGRLVIGSEPTLALYLDGSFAVATADAPPLPLAQFVDAVEVTNDLATYPIVFNPASKDLVGSPDIGRCGPLVTPNLYTPPGVALTVCDTPPSLTTYSVTVNSTTGTLAGEINEVYAYLKDSVLMLYAGKKVGDLVLSWVGQDQSDVQVMGFVEGAPPAPAANLTNKPTYAGATSLTFAATTSVSLKYQQDWEHDWTNDLKLTGMGAFGLAGPAGAATTTSTTATSSTGDEFEIKINISPMGAGMNASAVKITLGGNADATYTWTDASGKTQTSSEKLDELNRYVVRLEGDTAPYTGDLFMAGLNTATVPQTTPGVPASKLPILPDPNVGGFTTSNPAGPLPPHQPTEERFGQRTFLPSPYGQAFVTSQTQDIYQETLLQTNTVYGFVAVPDTQIPRDINIVSFRISSSYLRPGSLDGFITYGYDPATLPTGQKTYTTSTGEMTPVTDGNFSSGEIGHNASYMRVVEAYTLKRQIDQEAFTAFGIYNTAYDEKHRPAGNDPEFIPALDFYNEYVWTARGGTEEVRHTYQTSYEEVLTSSSGSNWSANGTFDIKLAIGGAKTLDFGIGYGHTDKTTTKYSFTSGGTSQFDITASFDGIESDTQMRYSSNNDAHFVMRNNSMFNPANESGLNLVIGSDGLVYNIVPSVTSGAGIPVSDNIDTTFVYTQPQPSYTTGNADGLSGLLEPYDRPGKTSQFRSFAYFLQPSAQNGFDFWSTVVDQKWLANSPDADAVALRPAKGSTSMPWRVLYRVTDSERYLPPVSSGVAATPQITPLMAVPVLEPASNFLFARSGSGSSGSSNNPLNDIESNVVLVAPTATGQSAGTTQTAGPNRGLPIPPNNVIPFDLIKTAASIVSWGDSNNDKILGALITSALGQNAIPMSRTVLEGSTVIGEIQNPEGGVLYTSYLDPNGFVVNVATDPAITVYQDVNGNPISFFDGQEYRSLQSDYVAAGDGTILYYIQPPSTYDPSSQPLVGDYDLLGHPGDEWRYFLVSGTSADMSAEQTFSGTAPFLTSTGAASYTGFTVANAQHDKTGRNQVQGYLVVKGLLQWPALNVNAESFADLAVYKAMSLLDTFPLGDPSVLDAFLNAAFPNSIVAGNTEISEVFARNIVTYLNSTQQALIPQ
jgi:hypothetical protein